MFKYPEEGRGDLTLVKRTDISNHLEEKSKAVMIHREVVRRIDRLKAEEDRQLECRRQQLRQLVDAERRVYDELSRQALTEDRSVRLDRLRAAAAERRAELAAKERQLADAKNRLRYTLGSEDLRRRFIARHLTEIVQDRKELEKAKQVELRRQAEEDRWYAGQKTLLDKQLDAGDERRARLDPKALARENLSLAEAKRRAECEHVAAERASTEFKPLLSEHPDEAKQRQDRARQLGESIKEQIAERRQRMQQAAELDKSIDQYCQPNESFSTRKTRSYLLTEKANLCRTQLAQIEYQKRLAEEERCIERAVDRKYLEMAEADRLKSKQAYESGSGRRDALELSKAHKEEIDRKLAADRAKLAEQAAFSVEFRRKQEELLQQERSEAEKLRTKGREHGAELTRQIESVRETRLNAAKQESELDRQLLNQAEAEAGRLIDAGRGDDPLSYKLHPWRSGRK